MRPLPLLLLTCAMAQIFCAHLTAQAPGSWPFGHRSSLRGGLDGIDAYNLGVLGAKARDATPSEGALARNPKGPGSATRGDAGPERLEIVLLQPKGPAESAGLLIGDVIVGVFDRGFENGSFAPLADALLKAELARRPLIELQIERQQNGRALRHTLSVALKPLTQKGEDPTRGVLRDAILTEALDWLAEQQLGDGSFAETLAGKTGVTVVASVAGLAWLGGGSMPGKGKHGKNLSKAFQWVARNLDAPVQVPRGAAAGNWNQTNWSYAYAGLFFGELLERDPKSKLYRKELQRIVDHLVHTQEKSGGWGHGPGGKNANGYVELNIVSGLVLATFGLAERHSLAIDPGALDLAIAYLDPKQAHEA